MIEFIVNNWQLLVVAVAVIAVAAYAVYAFVKAPRTEQIKKVQEWLLWAVTEAERTFGGGTGQIKLRYVYDMFVGRFPVVAKIISFETFSIMVDEALEKFREMLSSNKKIEAYVSEGEVG